MACTQDPDLHLSIGRRIFIFILGITDSLLFGGAVFGWPQLVYTLKSLNVYSDLCENDFHPDNGQLVNLTNRITNDVLSPPKDILERCLLFQNISLHTNEELQETYNHQECPAQDERFALIFTIAVLCFGIPGIGIGFLLHYVGLRTTRMLGGLLVASSFICLSAVTVDSPNWLFPSVALLALGGNTLRMCGMQLGDLFPKNRSTAITLMSGVYAASSSLFLVFSMMAEIEIPISYVSYLFAAVAGASSLLSFLMPLHHIPYEKKSELTTEKEQTTSKSRSSLPLKSSLVSLSSSLHLYWFFIGLFTINVYQQAYNVWVTDSSCTMDETRIFTNWFSYSNLISVFMAPVGGAFTDYMVKKARRGSTCRIEFSVKEIQANFIPILVTTVLSMVMYGCFFFHHPIAIVISLMCMIVVRPCVIAISTAYLRIRFPGDHFNRLLGIYSTVASILLFLQFPHFNWSQNMYYLTHLITILFLAVSLLNPLHLLWSSYLRKEVKERDNLEESEQLQTQRNYDDDDDDRSSLTC